jgi:hypothetical protein
VRLGRLALPTPAWQTGTLLLRYRRVLEIDPCWLWPPAGSWEIRQGPVWPGLGSRTGTASKMKGDGNPSPKKGAHRRHRPSACGATRQNGRLDGIRTRIPRLERPGSWTLRRQGGRTAGPASPFTPLKAHLAGPEGQSPSSFHKEHTPSSLSPPEQGMLGRFGRPRDFRAGVG